MSKLNIGNTTLYTKSRKKVKISLPDEDGDIATLNDIQPPYNGTGITPIIATTLQIDNLNPKTGSTITLGGHINMGSNAITSTGSIGCSSLGVTSISTTSASVTGSILTDIINPLASDKVSINGNFLKKSASNSSTVAGIGTLSLDFVPLSSYGTQEYGQKFTLSSGVIVTNLALHRTTTPAYPHTMRLWSGAGSLILTTATTSPESSGWNLSSTISQYLLPGDYVVSFTAISTVEDHSIITNATPLTSNYITVSTHGVFDSTGGTFPTIPIGYSAVFGVDLVYSYPIYNTPLNLTGVLTTLSGSMATCGIGFPRIIYGNFDPTASSICKLTCGSPGFSSTTYSGVGRYIIYFTIPFTSIPSILLSLNSVATYPTSVYTASITHQYVSIITTQTSVALVDEKFSMMAIGI